MQNGLQYKKILNWAYKDPHHRRYIVCQVLANSNKLIREKTEVGTAYMGQRPPEYRIDKR